jgi:multiple sugar transport system substrate-binding protein
VAVAVVVLACSAFVFGLSACSRDPGADATRTRIVLKTQPLWGEPAPFRELLRAFQREHPDVELVTEFVPNASDLTHQFYLTALEGGAQDFDVLAVDTVWVREFAQAGWIAELTDAFPPEQVRAQFLSGAAESVLVDERTFAVPWFVDVGLLYYRTDLVPRAPRSYAELQQFARAAMTRQAQLSGYVWQGRQYEGLSCNVYEALWGHGGNALVDGKLAVDTPAARAALRYLRRLITSGISPASTTSMAEEEARRFFQDGRAVFMRNWPYAWKEAQAPDSKIRGRVAVAPLPTQNGEPGAGVLGGWHLAVNAHVRGARRKAAEQLIAHLTSLEANIVLAVHYARNPTRRNAYTAPEVIAQAPFIASLLSNVERARPRPLTPYYVLLADILQGEFSAATSGLRSPEEALARAQRLADHLMEQAP